MSPYVRTLVNAWRLAVMAAVLGVVFATLFSFASPLRYSSTVRLLITQLGASGLDPYTALKATERIAGSLSELVYTTSFFNNVMAQAGGFDSTYFPTDEYNKRQEWRRSIETSVTPGTGIMTVTAFHSDREQARILVDAASREMASQAPTYFGGTVRVQVIDSPLDSRWFARPRFLANAIFGFFIGLFIGIVWILSRATKRNT